eukprot:COSAG02_NODE_692_length_18432_cov_12.452681_7_plen_395_part_00
MARGVISLQTWSRCCLGSLRTSALSAACCVCSAAHLVPLPHQLERSAAIQPQETVSADDVARLSRSSLDSSTEARLQSLFAEKNLTNAAPSPTNADDVCSSPKEPAALRPDESQKKFVGKDAWKNWIDWDSPFREETDELNRRRHFFYHVDDRGRLFRRERAQPPPKSPNGEIRDAGFIGYFFSHVQPTLGFGRRPETDEHARIYAAEGYHFVCRRAHEAYWLSCNSAAVVFNQFTAADEHDTGVLQLLCPGGETAPSLDTKLNVEDLRMCSEGKLYHPVVTVAMCQQLQQQQQASSVDVDRPRQRLKLELLAVIDSRIAEQVLEYVQCVECPTLEHGAQTQGATGLVVRDPSWPTSKPAVPLQLVHQPLSAANEIGPVTHGVAKEELMVEGGD